ncbi:uncharacterized protein LOC135207637 [Macrobrachium nipponense]|uniref:uncharacterized protein LOC135207637 n=1 Tax=Macrobrachium nipponense TaxID=159736 RepID=UPI0030C8BB52
MAILKAASVFVILFALAAAATPRESSGASSPKSSTALKEDSSRTIFLDGGSTDEFGITDAFLYLGTFTLAVVIAMIVIGIIYGANEANNNSGYEAPAATGYDSYSAYDQVYQVARSLYDGYKKYEATKAANL